MQQGTSQESMHKKKHGTMQESMQKEQGTNHESMKEK